MFEREWKRGMVRETAWSDNLVKLTLALLLTGFQLAQTCVTARYAIILDRYAYFQYSVTAFCLYLFVQQRQINAIFAMTTKKLGCAAKTAVSSKQQAEETE